MKIREQQAEERPSSPHSTSSLGVTRRSFVASIGLVFVSGLRIAEANQDKSPVEEKAKELKEFPDERVKDLWTEVADLKPMKLGEKMSIEIGEPDVRERNKNKKEGEQKEMQKMRKIEMCFSEDGKILWLDKRAFCLEVTSPNASIIISKVFKQPRKDGETTLIIKGKTLGIPGYSEYTKQELQEKCEELIAGKIAKFVTNVGMEGQVVPVPAEQLADVTEKK